MRLHLRFGIVVPVSETTVQKNLTSQYRSEKDADVLVISALHQVAAGKWSFPSWVQMGVGVPTECDARAPVELTSEASSKCPGLETDQRAAAGLEL